MLNEQCGMGEVSELRQKWENVYIYSHELTPSVFLCCCCCCFLPMWCLCKILFLYNRILSGFLLLNAVSNCTLHAFLVYFQHVPFYYFCNSSISLYILWIQVWDPLFISPCTLKAWYKDLLSLLLLLLLLLWSLLLRSLLLLWFLWTASYGTNTMHYNRQGLGF